jgi:3-hydroxyisobutyrate dehydrogenase-like beta-hydroxyacid dehydrogenase
MASVSVIGLGAMGARVAGRLLDAGHELTVWNRSPEKAEPLVESGARLGSSPADAARTADVAFTMVSDPHALEEVTSGADGALAGLRPGSLYVEMSTVGPQAVRDLAERLPEGVRMVDAPVLGSLTEVETGTLHIFVGGDPADYARAEPFLGVLGEPKHVGPLGSGAAAKLVANSTLVGLISLLGEAVALGEALGLETSTVFDVLSDSPLAAQAARRRSVLEGHADPRFALRLADKDAGLVSSAGSAASVELPVAEAGKRWFDAAVEAGWGDLDYSALLAFITQRPKP